MNKDRPTLLGNSIYNVVYRVLNVAFALVSTVYVSHILLASGVGKVAAAQNAAQYFVLIAALGLPDYGTREMAKHKGDREQQSRLFAELFRINAVSTLLCCAAYYLMIALSGYFAEENRLYLVSGLMIAANLFNVEWYYQGEENYRYIMLRNLVVKAVLLLTMIVVVRSKEDYIWYAWIMVGATLLNYVWGYMGALRDGMRIREEILAIRMHLRPVLTLLGTAVAIESYTLLDVTMLSFFCGEEQVGYYSNAMKLVKILITVITAVGAVLLPRLSYYYGIGKTEKCSELVAKAFYAMWSLFLPCGIGLFLVADELVIYLFGASFSPAADILRIAALLVYTLGFSNLFGTQVLLTFGQERKLFYGTLAGMISNIVLNAWLIPHYQGCGAAIASVISEAIVTALAIWFASAYIRYRLDMRCIVVTLVAGVVMALSVMAVGQMMEMSLLRMAVEIMVGGVVYGAVCFVGNVDNIRQRE